MNFLPGWSQFMGGAAADTVEFFNSAVSTGAAVTMPASITAGYVIFYFDYADDVFSAPSAVTPSNFTNFINFTGSAGYEVGRHMVSYKIADGTEGGTSITGMNGGEENNKQVIVIRGSKAITAVTIQDQATEGTSGNPASQTCNASGGALPLVVFGGYATADVSSALDPRTFSPASDGEVSSSTHGYAKYKIYNESPQDHSIDMDDEGGPNFLVSFFAEFTF